MRNTRNEHFYARENPHIISATNFQQRFSLNVWAGIVADKIIGPYFIDGTLTGVKYRDFLENVLPELSRVAELPNDMLENVWYMHDGAPPHYSIVAREYLNEIFPRRWIGRGGPVNWPARSPDLNAMDFFAWGYIKFIVFSTPVDNINDLRERIVTAFDSVRNNAQMLRNVHRSMSRRVEACILAEGAQFEQLL